MQEVFIKNSSANCVKKGRDNKLNKDNDNIVGYRLYLEGIERKKRLALLKKEYYKPNLPLKTALGRKRTNRNSFECDSNDVDSFQQLYDLSKPLQEDEKNRRKDIEEASAKRNEVWVPRQRKYR